MRQKVSALLLISILGCNAGDAPRTGLYVDKYRIGRWLNSEGTATGETNTYSTGDSICMSFEVKNVPSDSPVRVVFLSLPDKRTMAELDRKTSRSGFVSFELKSPSWPVGTYRAEYFLLGGPKPTGLGHHDFAFGAPTSAGATPHATP